MTVTIESVVENGYTLEEKDDQIIAACDKVYESHRKKYPSLKGEVSIMKVEYDTSGATVSRKSLKIYKY